MRHATGVWLLSVIILTQFLLIGSSWAKTVYVAQDAAGNLSGDSWINAATSIKAGLALSASGDEVWVKAGTYREPVVMPEGVALVGGFAGTENAMEQRAWRVNRSIIAGATQIYSEYDTGARVFPATGCTVDGLVVPGNESDYATTFYGMNVFECSNAVIRNCSMSAGVRIEFATVMISSSTFARCDYQGSPGSAVSCKSHYDVQLIDCVFINNKVLSEEGTVFVSGYSGKFLCRNCKFADNEALYGGALSIVGSYHGDPPVEIIGCTFVNNKAFPGKGPVAADLYVREGVSISDCTFSNNKALNELAISSWGALDLARCSFEGYWSGVFPDAQTMEDCTFRHNVIGAVTSSEIIDRCVFEDNTFGLWINETEYYYRYDGDYVVNNCVFVGNGVGIQGESRSRNSTGDLFVSNSTLTGNNVAAEIWSPTWLYMANSIIWGNTREMAYAGATVSNSNIQGGYPGVGNINQDPKFVHPWDGNTADLYLLPDSPCIDRGDNQSAQGIHADLDGNIRIWDGDDVPGAVVDMGAYEYGAPPKAADCNNDAVIDISDLFQFAEWWDEPVSGIQGSGDLDGNGIIDAGDMPILLKWLRR